MAEVNFPSLRAVNVEGVSSLDHELSVQAPATAVKAMQVGRDFFAPRTSLAMTMARSVRDHAHIFEQLQRLRDEKITKLKQELPGLYQNISGSITYQKWADLLLGVLSGGAQVGSALTPAGSVFQAVLKGAGEGGAIRGFQQFWDAGCQSDQTLLQGRKSEKESQREGMVQGGNSADQAFQQLLQMIKEIAEIEKAMGIR